MKLALSVLMARLFPLIIWVLTWTFAAQAGSRVEIHGLEETLATYAERLALPARLQAAWDHVSRELALEPSLPGPAIYIYPFMLTLEPPRLVALQKKFMQKWPAHLATEKNLEMYLDFANGLTYDAALFEPGDNDIGRVIQINPKSTFAVETKDERDIGVYVAAHEMIHYALNLKNVPAKYHHCAMIPWLKNYAPQHIRLNSELQIICNNEISSVMSSDGRNAAEVFMREVGKISATFAVP